jgi:hypothetical protein
MLSFDHFIYAVPDLNIAIGDFLNRTGVTPVLGGQHLSLGTQNALVSLGSCYFEILSPDPGRDETTKIGIDGLINLKNPNMIAWALQCSDFGDTEQSLKKHKMRLSPVESGSHGTTRRHSIYCKMD